MTTDTSTTSTPTRLEDAVQQLRTAYVQLRRVQDTITDFPEDFTYVKREDAIAALVACQHLITGVGAGLQSALGRTALEDA